MFSVSPWIDIECPTNCILNRLEWRYETFYITSYVLKKNQRFHQWLSGARCDCKTDWLWALVKEMKYLLKFIFPFLRSARRWVLPLNAQCLQNWAESGERSVLTIDSLCLPCCVRDTAWSWFIFLFISFSFEVKQSFYCPSVEILRLIMFKRKTF